MEVLSMLLVQVTIFCFIGTSHERMEVIILNPGFYYPLNSFENAFLAV
jgi:hypothetical protein